MTLMPEEIAAYADGELSRARLDEVDAAVKADPDLARQVERHRAMKTALAEHYAPVLDQHVPDRLAAMLTGPTSTQVADFAAARDRRDARRRLPRWGWIAGPALAASLVLAVFLPGSDGDPAPAYADAELAGVLEDRLVADQSQAEEVRVLLTFRSDEGRFCRAFGGAGGSGIACRDDTGWRLEALGEGGEGGSTEYRMAGADEGDILARAQDMAAGPALDADGEHAARARGWR